MIVLGVLFASWLAFRAAGGLGFEAFNSWRDSGRWALAVMLVFTGSAHFNKMRHDLAKMVPEWMPRPMMVIYSTGVLELAGALGILVALRELAGVCLALLFIAMFPANVKADREKLSIAGQRATPLWLRLPMQALFVWLAWWTTRVSHWGPATFGFGPR